MTKTFNSKSYQGKNRIYSAIPRSPRISRLWVWDEAKREYTAPANGNLYYAARYEASPFGVRKRVYESFPTLEEARTWQSSIPESKPSLVAEDVPGGPLFSEVVAEWKRRRYPQLAYGTQIQYEKMLRNHFGGLMELPIHDITPKLVDGWLDERKAASQASIGRAASRYSFDHELTLLALILRYYVNYHDDANYQFPIKKRHREAIHLNRRALPVSKDLSEDEFMKFRQALLARKDGNVLGALATVQYYQALRISEGAGLYWEDLILDWANPQNSRLKIVRSVCFPHKGGQKAFVKGGFKNAKANGGMKEQPMFPETFEAIKSLWREGANGLIFQMDGEPIPYKTIQWNFDRSFKAAGLPYRGTHVMRHGGCRRVFNHVGEIPIAQQLLGNSDLKTTLVYAKRHASALTKVAHDYWAKKPTLLATACKPASES